MNWACVQGPWDTICIFRAVLQMRDMKAIRIFWRYKLSGCPRSLKSNRMLNSWSVLCKRESKKAIQEVQLSANVQSLMSLGRHPDSEQILRGISRCGINKQERLGAYLIKDNEIKDGCQNIANRKKQQGNPIVELYKCRRGNTAKMSFLHQREINRESKKQLLSILWSRLTQS